MAPFNLGRTFSPSDVIARTMVTMAPHFPSQRLFESGWKSLSDMELVALLVGPGTSEGKAMRDAQRLLEVVGSAAKLGEITWEELHRAGLGRRKALAILAAVELRTEATQGAVCAATGRREAARMSRSRAEHRGLCWSRLCSG